jgi:hypothetical protein
MESKNIALKWEEGDFSKFAQDALVKLGAIPKKGKKEKLDINPEYKYFVYNNNQVEIKEGENNFYEFTVTPLPKSFSVRYGCELETCFVLNCTTNEFNDFIAKEIKKKKEGNNWEEKFEQWKNLILFHIQTNLVPYFSKEFLKRFPYAYIMSYHSEAATYVDLASGEEIFKNKEVDAYKTIQFAQDASVKCGDTDQQDTSLSVHCEIISPILKDISEIKLIYENLISEACNSSNSSAGYHVNVSIVDEADRQVKLTPIFLYEICKRWYPFEKKHYAEYRGQGTDYAINMSEVVDDTEFMKTVYKFKENPQNIDKISTIQKAGSEEVEMKPISDDEILGPETKPGIRNLYYMYQINDKFTSLHRKPNTNILEFRVFPSKNKMDLLVDYTKKAIKIIENSVKNILENPKKVSEEYNYLVSKYEESKYFNFSLYQYTNYKGSFKTFQKLAKLLNNIENVKAHFKKFSTEITTEEIQETTFLFFFKEKNIVKVTKNVKGLTPGDHVYTFENKFWKQTLHVKYLPDEDFIEIDGFKREHKNNAYDSDSD